MEPQISSIDDVQKRSGYKAVQKPQRPSWAGVDLPAERRIGALHAREPRPFPNARFPPERQRGESAVPKHNRPNKPFPPVFSTATPLRGLSGVVRRLAYGLPDHKPGHWLLLMLGDRVESWGHRVRRVAPFALGAAVLLFGRRLLR